MTLTLHPTAYLVRGLAGPDLGSAQIGQIDLLQTALDDPAVIPVLRAWYAEQARLLGLMERPRLYCVMAAAGMLTMHLWPAAAQEDWLALATQNTDTFCHYEVWN